MRQMRDADAESRKERNDGCPKKKTWSNWDSVGRRGNRTEQKRETNGERTTGGHGRGGLEHMELAMDAASTGTCNLQLGHLLAL